MATTPDSDFYAELSAARGKPGVGGMSNWFLESLGANRVPMKFYEPDARSFHQEYYYNTRQNVLYRRKILSKFNAIWQPVNII